METSSTPLLLGIDLGTSFIKVVLLDGQGNAQVSSSQEYPTLTPQPEWVEQDPQTWLRVTLDVIRKVLAANPEFTQRICAIGFSGQMHGTVCLDRSRKVLRPAIIWADRRSRNEVRLFQDRIGRESLSKMIGNPLAAGFMLSTCLWLQSNEPDIWNKTATLLLPKDYLRFCFTGEIGSEPSDASATALFDLTHLRWNEALLKAANIAPEKLPQVSSSSAIAGRLKRDIASLLGLNAGIPIVFGGSDQACQALGCGIYEPGKVLCTIGTGGQIIAPLTDAAYDPFLRLHLFCHAIAGLWHLQAATLAAGLSLRWLRDLFEDMTYKQLVDLACNIAPGAEGLFFAPYLLGERTPHMDPFVRGAFVGFSIHHWRAHLVRAVMEGVIFSLRECLELIAEKIGRMELVIASGGATKHPLWLQLQADIFNLPIIRSVTIEPAACGAAILAGAGAGIFPTIIDGCIKTAKLEDQPVLPAPQRAAHYQELYQLYLTLYPVISAFRRA